MIARILLLFSIALSAREIRAEPSAAIDGYRGIWYMNQPTGDEFGYKYSGGLGTYPQQHTPIAIYSAAVHKTFFCYGGATSKELACMVSYFDHETGLVPRPRVVVVKNTDDAHENPTIQIDETGHVWMFCSTHGPAKNSYIFRGIQPFSIDEFVQVTHTSFSYSQPWVVPGRGFLLLHTQYTGGRRLLHWTTSADGRAWSSPAPLATVAEGHYQISNRYGERVATAFNYHPQKGGLNARTNLYYLETADMGATWQTASGEPVATPITQTQNAALVGDYEANGKLVYLKDLNFDAAGRPIILYLVSNGHEPVPTAGKREWFTAHWTGDDWQIRPFTVSDHNYDYGPLYIDGNEWRVIAPTEPGPQPWTNGGELVLWKSGDEGATWTRLRQITQSRRLNHTYARRPVHAHSQFYAFWADGNPLERSESRLYFTDRDGSDVWQLPTRMEAQVARPRRLH